MDGTTRRLSRRRAPVSAIFIHAGAGYHSLTNETIHLEACSEAARTAMKLLQAGGTALEAVEAAIKALEDKEIANAGYGSNLAIDGTVECDATIVDHLGRSGAVGAVSNVKNPISLASLVLEQSRKPLSLRRVPPSLLVGEGAKDFAAEHNVPLVPNAWLVSKNAHDRYTKWEQDLKRAEAQDLMALPPASASSPAAINTIEHGLHPLSYRDHAKAIQTGVWNEGQPDSPDASPPRASSRSSLQTSPLASPGARSNAERSLLGFNLGARKTPSKDSMHAHTIGGLRQQGSDAACDFADTPPGLTPKSTDLDYFSRGDRSHADLAEGIDQDLITDTVGAIAIDQAGHIAAASSSGGIGMKHRGRVGPAALVGVGTSVIPQDEWDEDGVSIAAVTSGTGEHMATTMASQKCAERLYQWTKRGDGGADAVAEDETTILDSFICNDFQKHPGVRNSTSAGAIGVMAVKKSNSGFYLYFAHNTDSFALASMASTDREPLCVMSRLREHSHGVSQGARKIHIK